MWLAGFAPCLHTMYADKPMQGHGLMQAIAHVNRVLTPSLPPLGRASPNAAHCLSRTLRRARLRGKSGGMVVDYLGLADQLIKALVRYNESDGQGNPTFDAAHGSINNRTISDPKTTSDLPG